MYFITEKILDIPKEISLEDFLFAESNQDVLKALTKTKRLKEPQPISQTVRTQLFGVVSALSDFEKRYADILSQNDLAKYYHLYQIPKRSGGTRMIADPLPEIRIPQQELLNILKSTGIMHHNCAYAYSQHRNILDDRKCHQRNHSIYFFHSDFANFFGSTTQKFCIDMLCTQYPFYYLCQSERDLLFRCLKLCFLHGGLPQGTVISPWLTNQIMVPIDYQICSLCSAHQMIYTRYADDICISSAIYFPRKAAESIIMSALQKFSAPYSLKSEKTKLTTIKGANWHLGTIYNQYEKITVGHEHKRILKSRLHHLVMDETVNHNPWTREEKQSLKGLLAYYKMVEKEYFENLIANLNRKFNVNIMKILSTN